MSSSSPHQSPSTQNPTNSHRFKPKFDNRSAVWRCMTSSDISYINKYKPKILQSVSISSLRSENIGANDLRNLRKAMASSKRLSSILLESPEINAKQLAYLLDSNNHWECFSLSNWQQPDRMDQKLLQILSRLARCKNLTSFPFPSNSNSKHIPVKTMNRLCRQLKALTKLQSLSLSIPLWRHLIVLDKPPRSLTNLILTLENKSLLDQSQLSAFLSNVQKCSQLESLRISFSQDFLMEPSDTEIWTSFFQNPPRLLKKLHLYHPFNVAQRAEGIVTFLETLKHLKTLTDFRVAFFSQPGSLQDALFNSLLTIIQNSTHLDTLVFRLQDFHDLKKKGLQDLNSALRCLKDLKNLTLNLNLMSIESPHQSLIETADSLKQLTNLQTLDLLLAPATPFSHESMQVLSKSIAQLPLTSLTLSFGSAFVSLFDFSAIKSRFRKIFGFCKSREKPKLIPFFQDISQLSLLYHLSLKLSSFSISSREFHHLSLALQDLQNLSSLQLYLPQFEPNNNFEGFRNLFSCLAKMPKLRSLNLVFHGSISNQEVEILSSSLAGCQSLTHFYLQFLKAFQLQDDSLYFLLSALECLLKLNTLMLMFEKQDLVNGNLNQEAFGEQAVSDFLRGLTILKNLSELAFTFNSLVTFQAGHVPLPPNLKCYENLRHLRFFIVDNSRYI